MAVPGQEYHSLVIRKAQLLASEHGGLSKIPRELQTKLGFDVIAGRKGSVSISVRIPKEDLTSRIAELRKELPKITFESAKPEPEKVFGKYTPQVSKENQTMEDFWIMQGWYKQDKLGIKLTKAKWKDDEKVRIEAVKFLVEKVLKKDPRDITKEDFNSNRLGGLFASHYKGSPHLALIEAGYQIHPWEMSKTPNGFYDSKENRAAAVRWLIEKLPKDPREITHEDFYSNRLCGLFANYYAESPYAALIEAGYQIHPWEMSKTPNRFYDSKENRAAAVRWLIEKLQKDLGDITRDDFDSNRLGGLLSTHYKGSPHLALLEAGCNLHPWEMRVAPMGFYESKENRAAVVKWLIEKLQKDPRDIAQEDFYSNSLSGMLSNYYGNSPYRALKEAGYQIHPWEMPKTPSGVYNSKENRAAAVRWLIEKLQKDPEDITREDFNSNRLGGLLTHYYNNSIYAALIEAGLASPENESCMERSGAKRFSE